MMTSTMIVLCYATPECSQSHAIGESARIVSQIWTWIVSEVSAGISPIQDSSRLTMSAKHSQAAQK